MKVLATDFKHGFDKGSPKKISYACAPCFISIFALTMLLAENGTAFASDKIAKARAQACRVETAAPNLITVIQHTEDGEETKREIKKLLRPWVPKYNKYADTSSARTLRRLADQNYKKNPGSRYSASTCSALKPLISIATSASFASSSGLSVKTGYILAKCGSDMCIVKSISAIADGCDYQPNLVPYVPACE